MRPLKNEELVTYRDDWPHIFWNNAWFDITVIPGCDSASIPRKSQRLRTNPQRGIEFEEAQELFSRPYWLDQRSDVPEQFRAIGWVRDRLYSMIFEVREDEDGEVLHLVTLWKSTKEEIHLYEQNS